MMATYWQKQGSEPLFAELEWNKPERKNQAGKIIIIGGHKNALRAPSQAFNIIRSTGLSEITLAMPDSTKRLVGSTLPQAIFLPSTPSGELALEARQELFLICSAVDMILLPGDSGRNSQTTQLIEELLRSLNIQAVVTKEALDTLSHQPKSLLERENTTIVASFAELQKLFKHSSEPFALTFQMSLKNLIESLHRYTQKYPASIAVFHNSQLIVASHGNVSTTKLEMKEEDLVWRTKFASLAACYQTWNPRKPFEALTQCAHKLSEEL